MADISLSDQYVLLLNNVVEENKALQTKINEVHSADQETLKDIANKMEALSSKVSLLESGKGRRPRQSSVGIRVPKQCSVSIYKYVYICI